MPEQQTPPNTRWARYNDLVHLNQVLWQMRTDPQSRADDAKWEELTSGYTKLIDENSRLRYWLEFVVAADDADLAQWRNGEFAASIISGDLGNT